MKAQAQPIGKYATDDVRRYVDKHLAAGILILVGGVGPVSEGRGNAASGR